MEILKKHIYLLAFLLMLFACEEREEPQPISGTPEFYLIGELNGEAFEYYAGVEGINEAFSYSDSSGREWYASRFNLNSDFVDTDELSFQFEFALTSLDGSSVGIATESGEVEIFKDSIATYYEVAFNSVITNPDYNYSWNFGDGSTSTEMNPIHRYPLGNTDYSVCLSIEDNNSCVAEICETVKPYLNGKLDISVNQNATGLWIFEPVLSGFEAINYRWTLADGNTINTRQIALQSDSNEVFDLCLNANTRQGEIYEKCIQVKTGINPDACISNFNFISVLKSDSLFGQGAERAVTGQLLINNSNLEIAEFDENYFEIIDSEPYIANENGEATRKVKFQLELRLVDENGLFSHLKITEGVMAVGLGN